MYLMRKLLFAFIVFYFHEMEYVMLQLASNVVLSLLFIVYLLLWHPFYNPEENRMQVLNELTYYIVSMLYLCFTDFIKNPLLKVYVGWVVILVVISNLIYPNFSHMMRGISPDIMMCCLNSKIARNKKIRNLKQFDKARKKMIKKFGFKLKEEFKDQIKQEKRLGPRLNQIAAEETYPELKYNVYQIRKRNTL
jgi:hypothetical protein